MEFEKEYHILPTSELICDILNNEPYAAEKALTFYERYIRSMALEPARTPDGARTGYFYDEDLAQELRLALCRAIPSIRRVLLKQHFPNRSTVTITDQAE